MRLREVGDGLGVVRVEMRDGRGSKLREITSMSKLTALRCLSYGKGSGLD